MKRIAYLALLFLIMLSFGLPFGTTKEGTSSEKVVFTLVAIDAVSTGIIFQYRPLSMEIKDKITETANNFQHSNSITFTSYSDSTDIKEGVDLKAFKS